MSDPTQRPSAHPPSSRLRPRRRRAARTGPRHTERPSGRSDRRCEEVLALLGDAPRRRDLLIEHLHKIQDRYGCLSAAHLVALASEMKMAMAEVYEVATFYHHFDVVKEGETAPPAITVRVCDSIACELAGSHDLLEKLPALLGAGVRVLHAPCVGRCETAPVAVVGQNPIPHATDGRRWCGRSSRPATTSRTRDVDGAVTPGHIDYAAYRAAGGYALAASASPGKKTPRRRDRDDGGLRPARPGRRRLSRRPQVEAGVGRARAAPDGDQHRRRRAGHVQGSLLPRARSAPLPRRRAHRRLGRRHRRDLHLPARRVPRLPRDPRAGDRGAAGESAVRAPGDPPAARRRRLHLRRRVRR